MEEEECFTVTISLPPPLPERDVISITDGLDSSLICIIDNDSKINLLVYYSLFKLKLLPPPPPLQYLYYHLFIPTSPSPPLKKQQINKITAGVVIGFDPVFVIIGETEATAVLTVVVESGILDRAVEVLFSTSDGTATSVAPIDFFSVTDSVLQFDFSNLFREVFITIVNDEISEDVEVFFGNLMTFDSAVEFRPETRTSNVTILEDGDDCKWYGESIFTNEL